MPQLENKLKWCLNKGKEGKKHRGLRRIQPDVIKAQRHIYKATHNLNAMRYFINGNYSDWAVSAAFYSMYHCLLAILAKHGYESRNQECTFAAVESLIKEKEMDLDMKWLKKIADINDGADSDTVISLREEFQYGTEIKVDNKRLKGLLDDARELIGITKEIIRE